MVSSSPADYLAPVQLSRSRSGHDQMYQVPYARTDAYKYSFFPATVRMWKADAILTMVVYDDAYFLFSRRLTSYLWRHLSNVI